MEPKKSLTMNGITGINFLYIINAAVMVGVSIYLTTHFYDTLYPTKLGGASTLCDISNFFNCDTATYSKISNIAGIPISFFGIIMGLLFLFSALMPSYEMERTASVLSKFNFFGCVALFLFSIIALGSLCPFCTVYYVLSGLAAYLLWKYGEKTWKPDFKTLGVWGGIVLLGSFFMYQTTAKKEADKSTLNASIVAQFRGLANLGDPTQESPYKVHMATPTFAESPIRVTVYSDFQCPFCKTVSEQLPDFIRRYGSKISIQYMFYPLDSSCNPNVKHAMHPFACSAAMIAACDPAKFGDVHDEIFANQEKLGPDYLGTLAKKHGLTNCLENPEIKNKVITAINSAEQFSLKSTPTIIVNGRKIEGSIPSNQFFAIFDDILAGNVK